jgi:hypothetical protein
MGSFDDFVAKEHAKRVAHFVRFAKAGNAPTLAAAIEIFGFCARDAAPIVEDAVLELL